MDESIRKKIESNDASSMYRFRMLKESSKTNASLGLHFMPIAPYLTDSFENIDALYFSVRQENVVKKLAAYVVRGIRDIMVICADGLSRMKEAIATAFPDTELFIKLETP